MSISNNCSILNVPLIKKRIQLVSNIVYAQTNASGYENLTLKMDILVPRQKGRAPAVLFITGGRFLYANKDSCIQLRMALAQVGFVTAGIEYRTALQSIFPKPLEDVKAAVRFLRAKADVFHIDPNNIAAVGESAGGYLAAFAGLTNKIRKFDIGDNLTYSSSVQAVVDLYGPSDLSEIGHDFPLHVQKLYHSAGAAEALWINGIGAFGGIDGGITADQERLSAANPINYVTAAAPPFLLMHGDRDNMVSPSQTAILHDSLIKHGVDSTRYLVKNAGHGGIYWVQPAVLSIITCFLRHRLFLSDK